MSEIQAQNLFPATGSRKKTDRVFKVKIVRRERHVASRRLWMPPAARAVPFTYRNPNSWP